MGGMGYAVFRRYSVPLGTPYFSITAAGIYPHASIEDEHRLDEYLDWLTQRLVKIYQVLRPIVKALP
jgi:hypothetical protein